MLPASAAHGPPGAAATAAPLFNGELGPDDPLDALHQGRAAALTAALFSRPEVFAADEGLDTEVRPVPAFSLAGIQRLAASVVDQILRIAPVSSEVFFADAVDDFDAETKVGALFGTLHRMGYSGTVLAPPNLPPLRRFDFARAFATTPGSSDTTVLANHDSRFQVAFKRVLTTEAFNLTAAGLFGHSPRARAVPVVPLTAAAAAAGSPGGLAAPQHATTMALMQFAKVTAERNDIALITSEASDALSQQQIAKLEIPNPFNMKTLVESGVAVQRFADFATEREAAPAMLRAAKELEQVEALLSRRDNLTSTEHAAHCAIHFGPKGQSDIAAYVTILRARLVSTLCAEYRKDLPPGHRQPVDKHMFVLLSLSPDFFGPRSNACKACRGVKSDGGMKAVNSTHDFRANVRKWIALLSIMHFDMSGVFDFFEQQRENLSHDHAVLEVNAITEDYVRVCFENFLRSFSTSDSAFYKSNYSLDRAPQFMNMVKYVEISKLPNGLLESERTGAISNIRAFNSLKQRRGQSDALVTDFKASQAQQLQQFYTATSAVTQAMSELKKRADFDVKLVQSVTAAAAAGGTPLPDASSLTNTAKRAASEAGKLLDGLQSSLRTKKQKVNAVIAAPPGIDTGNSTPNGKTGSAVTFASGGGGPAPSPSHKQPKAVRGIKFRGLSEHMTKTMWEYGLDGCCFSAYLARVPGYEAWASACPCGKPSKNGKDNTLMHPDHPQAHPFDENWWAGFVTTEKVPKKPT